MSDPTSNRASTSTHPATAASSSTTTTATTHPSTSRAQKYRPFRARGLFVKDLGPMLFGFGDQAPCLPETALLMEELLINHITSICQSAQRSALDRDRLKLDDVKFSLRHDPKKLARVEELLFMTEVIARARGRDDLEQYADEPIGGTKGKAAAATGEQDKEKEVQSVAAAKEPATLPTLSKTGGTTRPREAAKASSKGGADGGGEGEGPKKKKKKNKTDKDKGKAAVSTPMAADE
ncbi:BZ3500_MvSof-1268-A1-R1_Chr2-1g04367 [Microbotryum saponariae]|uniref:Transcription initiation factor TFIID subunit 13 n=1 Tax=Microbotryum saponariae TaxID=289078 RepID=A0A2X0KQG5_9BASI|nr:BZ3500_MvSof-1268-A1-R1_Chr2-1g04367 [Microbotryum saponariae]SCZ91563.1 BZ3501_MvSof-1269-A2-R1_Chr2-1g04023 [Microbotryum saponariae]